MPLSRSVAILCCLAATVLPEVLGRWTPGFDEENSILQDRDCGILQRNGSETIWPWIAQIYKWSQTSGKKKYVCSGTVVNSQYVITSATCISVITFSHHPADRIEVIVGSSTLGVGRYNLVRSYKIHKGYQIGKIYKDLALLKFREPLKEAVPICLPLFKLRMDYSSLVTIGWGVDEYGNPLSQRLIVRRRSTVPRTECYGKIGRHYFSEGISTDLLCTIPDDDSHFSDDGAPQMILRDGRWILVGLTNWESSLKRNITASTSVYFYIHQLFTTKR